MPGPTHYEIPHAAGATPDAETLTYTEGGQEFNLITDQRTVFAQDIIKELGGIYDPLEKTAKFRGSDAARFQQAVDIISNIPYYELPRPYAKYTQEALKEARDSKDANVNKHPGLEVMFRSIYSDNPNSRNKTCRVMAATEAAYNDGMAFVNELKHATIDERHAIGGQISSGELNDDNLARHNLTADQVVMAMEERTLDRPLANKILNLTRKVDQRTLESIVEAQNEGRLVETDFDRVKANAASPRDLTMQQAYDLRDVSKKRATKMERDLVDTLLDMGYVDKSIGFDTLSLTSKKANDFIAAKSQLLTPEQRDVFNAVRQGKGRPTAAATSKTDEEIAQRAPGVPVKQFAPEQTATLRVISASTDGIAGFTNDEENEIGKLSSTSFSKELQDASLKPGDLVVVSKVGSRHVAYPTQQTDRNYAIVERLGMMMAERTGSKAKPVGANDVPEQGTGTVFHADPVRGLSAIATDEKLIVLPNEQLNGQPKLLQNVGFAAKEPVPTPTPTPTRTRGGGSRRS